MPYITIESGVLSDEQKENLIHRLTEVSSEIMNVPQEFFSKNNFYTTASSRISRDKFANAVTVDDVVSLIKEEQNG